jgi:hypothetical protein
MPCQYPAHDSFVQTFRGRGIDAGRAKVTYEYGEPTVPVSKSRNQAQASLYVVGKKRSLMIEPQIRLRLHLGTTPGVSRVFMDGGLDAQTIRLEGNIVSCTAGVRSIVTRNAGPE